MSNIIMNGLPLMHQASVPTALTWWWERGRGRKWGAVHSFFFFMRIKQVVLSLCCILESPREDSEILTLSCPPQQLITLNYKIILEGGGQASVFFLAPWVISMIKWMCKHTVDIQQMSLPSNPQMTWREWGHCRVWNLCHFYDYMNRSDDAFRNQVRHNCTDQERQLVMQILLWPF